MAQHPRAELGERGNSSACVRLFWQSCSSGCWGLLSRTSNPSRGQTFRPSNESTSMRPWSGNWHKSRTASASSIGRSAADASSSSLLATVRKTFSAQSTNSLNCRISAFRRRSLFPRRTRTICQRASSSFLRVKGAIRTESKPHGADISEASGGAGKREN